MGSYGAEFKLAGVDRGQRIVTGHAAVFGNEDRVGDILAAGAFRKALAEKPPSRISVSVAHDMTKMPIGKALTVREDATGLYTETYIYKGLLGDDFLDRVDDMMAQGTPPGMSFTFKTRQSRYEHRGQKTLRHLLDVDLMEYCFADPNTTANPAAVVTGRKAGGGMTYHIEQDGSEFVVMDADGEVESRHPTRAAAEAAMARLMREGDEPETPGNRGKTADDDDIEVKAVWTTAYVNDLPDSAFLYVEPGGEKDGEGKTVPRGKRHFPVRDADGKLDAAHVRNAIARIPQSDAPGVNKATLQGKARRLLAGLDGSKTMIDADAPEWQAGAAPRLYAIGAQVQELAETVAQKQAAMLSLGEDTREGKTLRPEQGADLAAILAELGTIAAEAKLLGEGRYDAARSRRHQLAVDLLDLDLVS